MGMLTLNRQAPGSLSRGLVSGRSSTVLIVLARRRVWHLSASAGLSHLPAGCDLTAESLNGLRVLRAGLELGSVAGGRFTPAHALAMAAFRFRTAPHAARWILRAVSPPPTCAARRFPARRSWLDGTPGRWTGSRLAGVRRIVVL